MIKARQAGQLHARLFIATLSIGLSTMFALSCLRGLVMAAKAEREIASDLDDESTVHNQVISEALWVFDRTLLDALVVGIANGPNISYAAILDGEAVLAEAGVRRKGERYTRQVPIEHQDRGIPRVIGSLVLQGDLAVLKRRSNAWFVQELPLLALAILLVSAMLSLHFERRVTRRLVADASTLASYDYTADAVPFATGTQPADDEIRLLETKFNELVLVLRRNAEEKEVLIRELYHRTKNNMQTIIALLSIDAPRIRDAEARVLLDGLESKVYSMALVHQMLYENQDLSRISLAEYLRKFSAYLADNGGAKERGIRIDSELCEAEVTLDFAIPFGLVVAELVGNSLQHAFPAGRGGLIQVALSRSDERDGERLVLVVADDGIGADWKEVVEREGSMGLKLARSIAVGQLGGAIEFESSAGAGFRCVLRVNPHIFRVRV